ncbi:MAG: fimbrillin family protein [Bacteroidales bacterium]|jgi:hypothetical protein|nr:fimbrillin family protein [Bacteroidales bacterium]
MKLKIMILTVLVGTVAFYGCSKDNVRSEEGPLSVRANIAKNTISVTKSDVTSFSNSTIGVFVDDAAGAYSPEKNSTASVNTGDNSVSPSPEIYINANASVYAYYPAAADELTSPNATSSKNVSVVASDDFEATAQSDYMWATPVTVSKSNRTAVLNFNHALCKLVFSISLGDTYAGSGNLTKINLTSATSVFQTGTSGKMKISDGTLSGMTGTASLDYTGGITLTTTAQKAYALVAPVSSLSVNDITVALTIDGSSYSAVIPVNTISSWSAAYVYTYNINVSSSSMSVGSVGINDWTDGSSASVSLQ